MLGAVSFEDEAIRPSGPGLFEHGPEDSIQLVQDGAGPHPLQGSDLLPKGQTIEGKVSPVGEEGSEQGDDHLHEAHENRPGHCNPPESPVDAGFAQSHRGWVGMESLEDGGDDFLSL